MPAKNTYHDAVIQALIADGWKITHDPLTISFGGKDLFVDLGAERLTLGAERGPEKIADKPSGNMMCTALYSRKQTNPKDSPMDKIDRYREVVRRLIEEYASYIPSHGQIQSEPVIDSKPGASLSILPFNFCQ